MFVVPGRTFEETYDTLVKDHRRLPEEALPVVVTREWNNLLAILKVFKVKKKYQLSIILPANFPSTGQAATLLTWFLGRFKCFYVE